MNMFSILAVSEPSSLWATLIEWVHSWVAGGYGWTILVLIILVKLVLSPLDYLIKHSNKKSNLVQQKLAPQIAKLNKKYGDNKQMIQTQTQALYKREGYNVFGSCIVMLINMVLTMVIFFTLFSSLRTLSSYQAIEQYDSLHSTYIESVSNSYGSEEAYNLIADKVAKGEVDLTPDELAMWNSAQETATAKVQETWNNVADKWLWVKNIWVNDGHASPMPTLDGLEEMAKNSKIEEYTNYVSTIKGDAVKTLNYNNIAGMVETQTGDWNGYYILAILAILLSVASQFLTDYMNKHKNKTAQNIVDNANPQGKSMWFMKLLLPAMMAIFVFTTNAAFGIYVVTNSIISMIITIIINAIITKVFAKKQADVDAFLLKEAARVEKKANKGGAK